MSRSLYHTLVAKALGADGRALAMSASATDNHVYVRTLDYKNDLQYWELRPTRGGNGFAIVNKARGMCVARNGGGNGSGLELVGVEQIEINDKAVWRHETALPSYNAINSFVDFEQKINIPGDGPWRDGQTLITHEWSNRAPNELWKAVPDSSKVTVKQIDFDLVRGNIQDQQPLVAATQTLINRSDEEQTQTLTFRFLKSHTYGFHREKGLEVTEALEFKGAIPAISESKMKYEVKGTWKWSTSEEQTDEEEVTFEVNARIKPWSAVRVSALVLQARLDVPYAATLTYEFADGSKVDRTSSGFFSGVNGYDVTTKFEMLGELARDVKVRRFDRLAGGALCDGAPAHSPALGASAGSAE